MSRQVQLRKIVGRQIAKKRKEAGLTQEAMGPLVHLSTEGYARYERGETVPDIMFLEKLSAIFECSVVELVTQTSIGVSAQAQHIAKLLESVSTSDRDEIVKIVETVVFLCHKKMKRTIKPY